MPLRKTRRVLPLHVEKGNHANVMQVFHPLSMSQDVLRSTSHRIAQFQASPKSLNWRTKVLHISSFLEKSSIQANHWLLLTCSVSLVIHVLNLLGGSRPTSWFSSFNRPFRLSLCIAEAHIANKYSNWYGGVWKFATFWKHIELVDIIRHLNFDFENTPI